MLQHDCEMIEERVLGAFRSEILDLSQIASTKGPKLWARKGQSTNLASVVLCNLVEQSLEGHPQCHYSQEGAFWLF